MNVRENLQKNSKKKRKRKGYNLILKSKKANISLELIIIIIGVFAFIISSMFAVQLFDDMLPTLNTDITVTEATTMYTDLHNYTPSTLDGAVVTILLLLWVGGIALSFRIDTNPVFFVFNIFLLLVFIVVAMILSNTVEDMGNDISIWSQFPMSYFIVTHIVYFIFAIAGSIILSLYAKTRL